MSESFFDVVVLGTQLGALGCGALLAKRGFRVLHVDQDEPPPSYAVGEHTLPRSPFTFLAAHSPVSRRIFAELALHQAFRRSATAFDPPLQVAIPRHRLDFPLDTAELEREIERELPEVKRPVEDLLRNVREGSFELDRLLERDLVFPPETFFERRELARAAAASLATHGHESDAFSELPEAHPFRTILSAPLRFSSDMDPDAPSALRLMRQTAAWLTGSARLPTGYAFLHDLLLSSIRTHSGETRSRECVDRLVVRRGAITGVRLSSGDEIGCEHVIAGIDLAALVRLLPDRGVFEDLFERCGEPQPRYFRFTLNLVLRPEGLPVGMARDVFYVHEPRRALQAENLLRIQVLDDDAHAVLSVETLLPRRTVEERPAFFEDYRARVLERTARLVPFLREHLVLVDSPHDGLPPTTGDGTPLELPEVERYRRGPRSMRGIYGYPVLGALGVCALPVRTPVKRLLMASQHVVPGLGQEGELLAAWSASRVVSRSDRRKERMRRSMWTKLEI